MASSLFSSVEPLESRIAPAFVLTFTEVDHDIVTLKVSKGLETDAIITYDANNAIATLDLSNPVFEGASVTLGATRSAAQGGDSLTSVGSLIATGRHLGSVIIDGSLGGLSVGLGDAKPALAALTVQSVPSTAILNLSGKLGKMTVLRDFAGVLQGPGLGVGSIAIGGKLDGSVSGGYLDLDSLGSLTVGGDIVGGANGNSGRVDIAGALGSAVVKGSLRGGGEVSTGMINAASAKSITIGGDILAGTGLGGSTGVVTIAGTLGTMKLGGTLQGGSEPNTGAITAGSLGVVTVGGSVIGGAGARSGFIHAVAAGGTLGSLTIHGSLIGGGGNKSGVIGTEYPFPAPPAGGDIGTIKILGGVVGGTSTDSGDIVSGGKIKSISIGASLAGGTAASSNGRIVAVGDIGSVTIGRDLIGTVEATGGIVSATGKIGTVKIGGSMLGGNAAFTSEINANDGIQSITIGGDMIGGEAFETASIRSEGPIGSLTIGGSIKPADSTPGFFINISAAPALTGSSPLAIGKMTVGGDVFFARITAGLNVANTGNDPDAQIGTVTVGGQWGSSLLVAGVVGGVDGDYGTNDDAKNTADPGRPDAPTVYSKIAALIIKGGTVPSTIVADYAIAAQEIGKVQVLGESLPLTRGAGNDLLVNDPRFFLFASLQTYVREVALP